jgi:hypothetical protein
MSLSAVLKRCRDLSAASGDALYSSRSISQIIEVLDRGIEASERPSDLNRDELILLFAPTGDLQEVSLANGWADEYLLLSARFDGLIG